MCSYCGCRSITVIGRFSAEHDEIVNLCGALRRSATGTAPTPEVAEAAAKLRAALDPHTGSEERGLFAELRADPEFTEHVDALCSEHHDLHELLDRIAAGDHEVLPRFETLLRRHIDREENGLFPAAAIALNGAAWERVTRLS